MKYDDVFARHEKIAFQFSGGKDSTAALFLLRAYWPRMTVYWLNSGDAFPEVAKFVHSVAEQLPNFVEVKGRVHDTIAAFGPPADVVPFHASEAAHAAHVGGPYILQDRSFCCVRSKMFPLQERMKENGITLFIRGQKNGDTFKGPHKSGDVSDGIELLYPIETWTDDDVLAYVESVAPDALTLYRHGLRRSGDCMACSAWLGDARAEYLKLMHPARFEVLNTRLRVVATAVMPEVEKLLGTLETCN